MKKRQDLEVTVASQRRRQLLDAARACITEEGADKVTLRKVADRAGFSHGTIGYYFKDKKELIDEALREMARSYLNDLYNQEISPYGPDGPEALANLVESFVQRNADGAGFVVQMVDIGLHNADLRDIHHDLLRYGWGLIERMILAGIETGEFRPDIDPVMTARLIHSVMIWWGSELGSAATSREEAWQVGQLSIDLLRPYTGATAPLSKPVKAAVRQPTLQTVRAAVMSDDEMEHESAQKLFAAFETMYALALGQSVPLSKAKKKTKVTPKPSG